jgi:hypothetical protein
MLLAQSNQMPAEIRPEEFKINRFLNELPLDKSTLPKELQRFLMSDVDHKAVISSHAYQWLLGSIQREAKMALSSPNLMEEFRQRILSRVQTSKENGATCFVRFVLDWDPVTFVLEQQYTEPAPEALKNAITLTGSTWDDAQALTAIEYSRQVWPTTGEKIMSFFSEFVSTDENKRVQCKYIHI